MALGIDRVKIPLTHQQRCYIPGNLLPGKMLDYAKYIAGQFNSYSGEPLLRMRIDFLLDHDKWPLLLEVEMIEPNCNTDSIERYYRDLYELNPLP